MEPISKAVSKERKNSCSKGRWRGRAREKEKVQRFIDPFSPRPTIYLVLLALQEIAIASALLELSLVLSGPLAHRVMYPCYRLLRHAALIRTCARGASVCRRAIVWIARREMGRGVSAGALR